MGERDASEGTDERANQAPDGGGRETGGETETAPFVPSENREFDAFKMEYEKAAERYENVYRAVWQNFYYMAFFAGGIFAFGPARLPLPLLAAIGLVPLVFWFWATYLPLDRYGRSTRVRLGAIEDIFNYWFIHQSEETANDRAPRKQLEHYRAFANPPPEETPASATGDEATVLPRYPVQAAVCIFGLAITTLCITLFAWYASWILGWYAGVTKIGDSAPWLESHCFLLVVAIIFAGLYGLSTRGLVLKQITTRELTGSLKNWLLVASLIVFAALWFSFLTDGCRTYDNTKDGSVCWAEKLPPTPKSASSK